ncbi:MAG TPA: AraC family transcriptional regulator [Flavitalea sp.]|nr:AraC family transcriptional regulator [Flavitalea sp.]
MSLQLNLIPHPLFSFRPAFPDDYSGPVTPGCQVFSASGAHGNIVIQELATAQYAIRYNIMRFVESFKISGRSDHTGLHTSVAWKNNFHHRIHGAGNILLKESQFMILYGACEGRSIYASEQEYQSFDACYSQEMIEELKPAFPRLAALISKAKLHKPNVFFRPSRNITRQIREIILAILNCPYEESLNRTYIDAKIKEYLFLTIYDAIHRDDATNRSLPAETACVNAARELIAKDIYHHYTNTEISRMIGTNEYKLKFLFRKHTGMGMFEFLMRLRLEKARRLLIETDMTMKEICSLAGYKRISSFITGFKKQFRETPGEIRRNRSSRSSS